MALQKQIITVPFTKGLAESVDVDARGVDLPVTAVNGEWTRHGKIRKRRGFTELTNQTDLGAALDSCRGLYSTGEELVCITNRRLYALNETWGRWMDRGPVSPFCGTQSLIGDGQFSYVNGDVAVGDDNYAIAVLNREKRTDLSTGLSADVVAQVFDTTDNSVIVRLQTAATITGLGTSTPHAVRATSCKGRLLMLWHHELLASTELRVREWTADTPNPNFPTPVTAITADLYNQARYKRSFDAIRVGDNYLVAFIDQTAQNIKLELRNSSHTILQSSTITGPFYFGVALSYDSTNSQIYVLSYRGAEGGDVVVYGRASADTSAVWGPIVLKNYLSPPGIYHFGVAFGFGRVACVWSEQTLSGTSTVVGTTNRSTDTAGANLDAEVLIPNANMRSRPWYYNNRCYVALQTVIAPQLFEAGSVYEYNDALPLSEAWECSWVADLFINDANPTYISSDATVNRLWEVAAIYNVGTGTSRRDAGTAMGSANNVAFPVATEAWYISPAILSSISGKTSAQQCFLHSCDFAARPLATSTYPSTLTIGGGFVAWYDGVWTYELGHAVGALPISDSVDDSNSGNGVLVELSTYDYRFTWESIDAAGVMHRSVVSPFIDFTITDGTPDYNTIQASVYTNPCSNRLMRGFSTVQMFRAGTDTVFYKALQPTYQEFNTQSDYLTTPVFDDGTIQGATLYTEGGEIDAVCTEGARIPYVVGGRLVVAYVMPNDEVVTGLAGMDEKTVIFTDSRIYMNVGLGPADDGNANDFSGPTLVCPDVGSVSPHSVVAYRDGIFFQSSTGIMVLDRSGQVHYVGFDVQDTLDEFPTITSAVDFPDRHQLRFTLIDAAGTDGVILVYDYEFEAWSRWEPQQVESGPGRIPAVAAAVHQGVYYVAMANGDIFREDASTYYDDTTVYAPMKISTGWLSAADGGGWQRIRRLMPLLHREDHCQVTLSVWLDNTVTVVPLSSQVWTGAQIDAMANADDHMDLLMEPPYQQCKSIRVEIEDAVSSSPATTTGQGFSATGISFEIGAKRGLTKVASQQKA
jgi:hypothetical protein